MSMKGYIDPILIAIVAAIFFAFYYFMAIVVMKLPPGRFPYVFSVLGAALMVFLPIRLSLDGEIRWAYLGAIFSLLVSLGLVVTML